jgi:hypothetical protein
MQATARLPNIRVISTPVANVIQLQCIGSKLRVHYGDPLHFAIPEQWAIVMQRIA